jgi:hypothetical protein
MTNKHDREKEKHKLFRKDLDESKTKKSSIKVADELGLNPPPGKDNKSAPSKLIEDKSSKGNKFFNDKMQDIVVEERWGSLATARSRREIEN